MATSLFLSYASIPLLITTSVMGGQIVNKKNNEKNLEKIRFENIEMISTIEQKEDEIAKRITNLLLTSQPEEKMRAINGNNEIFMAKPNNYNIYLTFVCLLFLLLQMTACFFMSTTNKKDTKMYENGLLIATAINLFIIFLFQFYCLNKEDFFNFIVLLLNLILVMVLSKKMFKMKRGNP